MINKFSGKKWKYIRYDLKQNHLIFYLLRTSEEHSNILEQFNIQFCSFLYTIIG